MVKTTNQMMVFSVQIGGTLFHKAKKGPGEGVRIFRPSLPTVHIGNFAGWCFGSFLNFPSYMGCHPKPIDEVHDFSRWLLHHQPVIFQQTMFDCQRVLNP